MPIHRKAGTEKPKKEVNQSNTDLHRGAKGAAKTFEGGQGLRILGEKWDGRDTFTIEEAGCEILRLSRCSAYAAAEAGTLPVVRIGRRLLVPRHALEKLLAGAA